MQLPKITYPLTTLEIPSTKKKVPFRPFLVKEEKILLLAKASEQKEDIYLAIMQVINNCASDDQFDCSKLTVFDMEYLFMKLHAISVNNVIQVKYKDSEDDKIYDLQIPIDKVVIKWPRNTSTKIEINQKTGLIMKYVEADVFNDREFLDSGNDALFKLLCKSIAQIYDGEIVYDCSTYTLQEIEQFVEGLDSKIFEKLIEFVSNTPSLYYQLEYTNSKGTKRTIELKSLQDFFTLR